MQINQNLSYNTVEEQQFYEQDVKPADVNKDGLIDAVDLQKTINNVFGL